VKTLITISTTCRGWPHCAVGSSDAPPFTSAPSTSTYWCVCNSHQGSHLIEGPGRTILPILLLAGAGYGLRRTVHDNAPTALIPNHAPVAIRETDPDTLWTSSSRWRFRSVGQSLGDRWYSQPVEHMLFVWKCVLRTPLLRVLAGTACLSMHLCLIVSSPGSCLTRRLGLGRSVIGGRVAMCDSSGEHHLAGCCQSQRVTFCLLAHDCRHP
jgi:hypothetical protein